MRSILLFFIVLMQFMSYSQPSGNCIVLNGSTDYYEVADNSTLDPTSVVSFEAWVNPCDTVAGHMFFTKLWCSANRFAYYFGVIDGYLVWVWDMDGHCGNGVSEYKSTLPIINQNQWQHIAVVHTTSGVDLYYNGSLISGLLTQGSYNSLYNSDQPLRVGVYKGATGNLAAYFNGRIDELRKWNYALTPTEISSRMNMSLTGNEAGLELYHSMDNVSGTTIINEATSTGAINSSSATYGIPFFMNSIDNYPSAFNLGNDTAFCTNGGVINLTIASNGSSYAWNTGSNNQLIAVNTIGTYIGTANISGCFYKDTININEMNCDTNTIIDTNNCVFEFVMPNVFSPNNDNVNDVLSPLIFNCATLEVFSIYNRWGILLYSNKNEIKWNGKTNSNKDVSDGVYYWIIEYMKSGIEPDAKRGQVHLVR